MNDGIYQVEAGSWSGHCCFSHTVYDSNIEEAVAECMNEDDAVTVCRALNLLNETENG